MWQISGVDGQVINNQGYQSHWGCQSYLTRDTRGKWIKQREVSTPYKWNGYVVVVISSLRLLRLERFFIYWCGELVPATCIYNLLCRYNIYIIYIYIYLYSYIFKLVLLALSNRMFLMNKLLNLLCRLLWMRSVGKIAAFISTFSNIISWSSLHSTLAYKTCAF